MPEAVGEGAHAWYVRGDAVHAKTVGQLSGGLARISCAWRLLLLEHLRFVFGPYWQAVHDTCIGDLVQQVQIANGTEDATQVERQTLGTKQLQESGAVHIRDEHREVRIGRLMWRSSASLATAAIRRRVICRRMRASALFSRKSKKRLSWVPVVPAASAFSASAPLIVPRDGLEPGSTLDRLAGCGGRRLSGDLRLAGGEKLHRSVELRSAESGGLGA